MPGDPAARLAGLADVREWPAVAHPDPDELVALTAGATVLLCVNGDRLDEAFFDACPDLRLVALASTGYDSIDVAAADRRGIAVTNSRGTLFETTADLTFGLIIAARRRMFEAERYLRAGSWLQDDLDLLLGHDVYGATLGIVGYGEIGRAVARRATGFGMTVIHHRRTPGDDELSRWVPFDELLRVSDIVSLHVPMSPATRHLIGERELRPMKPTATLVNAARGGVARRGRPGPRAARGLDRHGRPRRPAGRTELGPGQPAPVAAELRRHAAHRLGHPGGARGDDRDGDRQRRGVPRGSAAGHAGRHGRRASLGRRRVRRPPASRRRRTGCGR